MIYNENIMELKKSMNINDGIPNSGKHNINKTAPFLPFKTRNPERPKFKRLFSGVTGELVRNINNNELPDDFSIGEYINDIVSIVDCNDEDREYLKEIIKDSLIDKDGNINIFHTSVFNYIQLTEGSEAVGEKEIAKFLYDVFFYDKEIIRESFNEGESKNLITKLILNNLKGLKERKTKEKHYKNNLKFITDVAIEDFEFLAQHKDFLLKNFQSLLAYYYFYYISQLSVKLNKKLNGDYTEPEKFYYLVDWEKFSKNRKSELSGYKYIKFESRDVLINVNIIEHLNFLFGVIGYNYQEINNLYNSASDEEKINYIETIKEWIKFYRKHFSQEEIKLNDNFNDLISILEMSLRERIDKATMSRYALFIEEIGNKYFLKTRGGQYGKMLNITQEMILILTAVSIKKDKITLKALFNEYERRGIFLDRYSKDAVLELLVKLNLIDKKSDSGDAQYVKRIL